MKIDVAPPKSSIDDLFPGSVPDGLDPLANGILMQHQIDWLSDQSDLKIAEKGRRTGITFAEALDCTLIAAAARSAGGDNVWYIGDTKDKGREFIATCAAFAKTVAKELLEVDEFMFEDIQADGSSKWIQAWRIRFKSGFQICALSSRPANIRGLQGIVVIDEAAFHPDVNGVIDACNALLIWGGKIRIISTHNGVMNAFNELIKQSREGIYDYKIHRITFDDAVANGLYERVCLIRGWEPSVEGKAEWYAKIRRSYGSRTAAMREELDAVPREGEGTLLPMAQIEACQTRDYKVVRWSPPTPDYEEFVDWPEARREAHMLTWLQTEVEPLIEELLPLGRPIGLGEDFAMRHDRTSLALGYTDNILRRHIPLIIELRQCPYQQQRQVMYYIYTQLKHRLRLAILDANGSGMALAQEARQKFGRNRVTELMPNDNWLREHIPPFADAFQSQGILLPADIDTRNDLMQYRTVNGVSRIPRDVRTTGTDDGQRHGDNAVSILNCFVALRSQLTEYGYEPAFPDGPNPRRPDPDDDEVQDDLAVLGGGAFGDGAW